MIIVAATITMPHHIQRQQNASETLRSFVGAAKFSEIAIEGRSRTILEHEDRRFTYPKPQGSVAMESQSPRRVDPGRHQEVLMHRRDSSRCRYKNQGSTTGTMGLKPEISQEGFKLISETNRDGYCNRFRNDRKPIGTHNPPRISSLQGAITNALHHINEEMEVRTPRAKVDKAMGPVGCSSQTIMKNNSDRNISKQPISKDTSTPIFSSNQIREGATSRPMNEEKKVRHST